METRGDLFDPKCPTRLVLDRIGNRWSTMVIILLREGPVRFSALRERARGITPKVLTQTLRGLERDGLAEREVFAEVPPRVEYRLTTLGRSLDRTVDAIRAWAEGHVGEIARAQASYDERVRRPAPAHPAA